MWIFSCEFLCR